MVQKKPIEAVFISDLHLHPEEPLIMARFNHFIDWAARNTHAVYILGDFFHAWPGDDGNNSWSQKIAERLKWLSEQRVSLYYMHGNRDFLLGPDFAKTAGMIILPEPTVIKLGSTKVLLVHGDRYCTYDKGHQWFRRITRNRWFHKVFLRIPFKLRNKMVTKVRQRSQTNRSKTMAQMDVVVQPMISHMDAKSVKILIHGHTHKVGLRNHAYNGNIYTQYVLSDWDENPKLLCYYKSTDLEFHQLDYLEGGKHGFNRDPKT